jgi:predicted NUDIX family NTP pyrophosphohydrolase
MTQKSAGILLFRFNQGTLEFMIVHPGGPFWGNKDEGAWSIPKGEFTADEYPLDAAIREFKEETGQNLSGDFIPLTPIKKESGKWIYAFARELDFDVSTIKSNTFQMKWPPKSGQQHKFPEIDRGEWVDYSECNRKLNSDQLVIVEELIGIINSTKG